MERTGGTRKTTAHYDLRVVIFANWRWEGDYALGKISQISIIFENPSTRLEYY